MTTPFESFKKLATKEDKARMTVYTKLMGLVQKVPVTLERRQQLEKIRAAMKIEEDQVKRELEQSVAQRFHLLMTPVETKYMQQEVDLMEKWQQEDEADDDASSENPLAKNAKANEAYGH